MLPTRRNLVVIFGALLGIGVVVVAGAILLSGNLTQINPREISTARGAQLPSPTKTPKEAAISPRKDHSAPSVPHDVRKRASSSPAKPGPGKQAALPAAKIPVANVPPDSAPPKVPTPSTPTRFHALEMVSIKGPPGATFQRLPDGSVLVTANQVKSGVYSILAKTKLAAMRGFRLEALADARLPKNGPGTAPSGNFVLSRFAVAVAARADEPKPAPVQFASAAADFSPTRFPVVGALGGKGRLGWSVAPQIGQGHWATFMTSEPVGFPGETWLNVTLEQKQTGGGLLGRFRITAITGDGPGQDAAAEIREVDQGLKPFAQLPPSISLPPLAIESMSEAERTESIGKLFVDPASTVTMELLQMTPKIPGEQMFALEPAGDRPCWNIRQAKKGNLAVTVAEIALTDHELTFRWTPDAAGMPNVNLLRNAVLLIRVDWRDHAIALRQPLKVAGLNLDCGAKDDGTVQKVSIPWLPTGAQVQVELLHSSIRLPSHKITNVYLNVDQEAVLSFARSRQLALLVVVQSKLSRGNEAVLEQNLRLKAAAYCAAAANVAPQPLNRSKIEQALRRAEAQKTALQGTLDKLTRASAKLPANRKAEKDHLAGQIKEVQQRIKQVSAAVAPQSGLSARASAVDAAGPLPYRVWLTVADRAVILVEAGAKP